MLTIEKNIPIPAVRTTKYGNFIDTVSALDVGDSFVFAAKNTGQMAYAKRKFPERMFTTRKVDGGVRVWRLA